MVLHCVLCFMEIEMVFVSIFDHCLQLDPRAVIPSVDIFFNYLWFRLMLEDELTNLVFPIECDSCLKIFDRIYHCGKHAQCRILVRKERIKYQQKFVIGMKREVLIACFHAFS